MKRLYHRIAWIVVCAIVPAGCAQSPPAPPTAPPTPSSTAADPVAPPPATSTQTEATPASEPTTAAEPPAQPPTQDPPPASTQDLLAKARNMIQAQNLAAAIETLEQIVANEPKNRIALGMLSQATQLRGIELVQLGNEADGYPMFLKSARHLRDLRALNVPLNSQELMMAPVILYNEACAHAKANEPDKAMASLKESIDQGFNDAAQLDKDPDLDPLRDRDDYKKLREGLGGGSTPAKPKEGQSE